MPYTDYLGGYIPDNIDLTKIIISVFVGGVIGLEREYRSKSAGFRTIILTCIGSTLFTILSTQIGEKSSPDRMAANIITGIGFLGAGAIFKDANNLSRGLNTATIIWITAALGVGIGAGHFITVFLTTSILMLILVGFPKVENIIGRQHQIRSYRICIKSKEHIEEIEKYFRMNSLKASRIKHIKEKEIIICNWTAGGSEKNHLKFSDQLFQDPNVTDFEF